MTSRRSPAAGAAIAIYSLILRLYPRDFRERCGEPMVHAFDDTCSATMSMGMWSFTRETAAELANAIAGIWRSRGGGQRRQPGRPERTGVGALTSVLQDIGYAIRRLRSQPAVVLFTVLTLGFAIAANAAIFSIVDAVLLRPSPFKDAGQLYNVQSVAANGGFTFPGLSRQKLRQWRTETEIFETVEAHRDTTVLVTGGVEPEELPAAQMSPGLLTTLGAVPRAGRLFTPDEGRAGSGHVVILSEKYWRSRLGADPGALGRSLTINGAAHRIVGILPASFHFPTLREQLWLPMDADARPGPGESSANVVARLKAGLTEESARQRIDAAVARLEVEQPVPTGWKIRLHQGLLAGADAATQRTVLILFGAVGLVLLTACANVANLLLSRAVDRQREFAIRLVLGASRGRLARELLVEGLLLGLLAGVAGLAAAMWAVDTLVAMAPPSLMYATTSSIAIDGRVIIFGLGLAVVTGVLCNLPPALRSVQQGNQALSGRTKASTATPIQRRLRGTLVVAEIALAVVLLIGAALMVRSFVKLNAIDIGFNPDKLLAVTIGLDTARYPTEAARLGLLRRVAQDARALPGVSGVALASGLPPSPGTFGMAEFFSEDGPCGTSERVAVVLTFVSADYFGLMSIPVAQGRPLREDDPPDAVVVSNAVANLCGGSLVGRRLRMGERAPSMTVVGVAGNVKTSGLTGDRGELAVYLPFTADPDVLPMVGTMKPRQVETRRLLLRAERPTALIADVKRLLWAHDPDQPVLQAVPAADLMAESITRERFMLALMTLFSAVTLALASAGIFGVLAYIVAQRANEIGIRMALGATSADVFKLVVGHGLRLAAVGVAGGLAGAYMLAKLLAGLLYEIDPRDPAVFVAMPALVFVVALLAAWIPTMRALRVDPANALRVE